MMLRRHHEEEKDNYPGESFTTKAEEQDLTKLTVYQLQDLCKQNGVPFRNRNKNEMIKALNKHLGYE